MSCSAKLGRSSMKVLMKTLTTLFSSFVAFKLNQETVAELAVKAGIVHLASQLPIVELLLNIEILKIYSVECSRPDSSFQNLATEGDPLAQYIYSPGLHCHYQLFPPGAKLMTSQL
ncbi:hypothetical protein Leryth_017209 [Lithospermum erythrorhizon]|nr:hypothetical protein Leryth_017209 [Lithospermum erythrorhizon]